MKKFDVVQAWIDNVAYSHSKSESTEFEYKYWLEKFCNFIAATPEHILEEYEAMNDRQFRRKYAKYVRAFISKQVRSGYAPGSVRLMVSVIKSFFKYNDLVLGHVPVARNTVIFHNRDVAKEEVQSVLGVSRPRDKAFFSMMAQSGLRPGTLCDLRLKHIEPEFSEGKMPCKIEVPEELAKGEFGAYYTYMGEESLKYLKAYLATRPGVGPEDYLFTSHGTDKRCNPKSMSRIFVRAIQKLKEKGIMDFDQTAKGKPRTVRLYNLRKFFRREAGKAGIEYVNFWMGHKTNYKAPHIPASDVHYFSREDVEFQRQLYKEKAMPYLRLETATPSETEQTIMELRNQIVDRDKIIAELRSKVQNVEDGGQELFLRVKELEQRLKVLDDPELIELLRELKQRKE